MVLFLVITSIFVFACNLRQNSNWQHMLLGSAND